MKPKICLLIAACLISMTGALAAAQGNSFVEAWFLYEQGKAKLEDLRGPELGEALLAFHQAIERRGGIFPEAEMAIGDIYFREGAFALAKRQYEKAYDLRSGMEVAEERYTVLYRLVELHEIQEHYADVESYLLEILADQPFHSDVRQAGFRDAFLNTYLTKGLDHLFTLYRMDDVAFAVPAHTKLGWFYYRTGRPTAMQQNLFALDIMITEAVKEIRRARPDYVFTNLKVFLDTALERKNISRYLFVENDFFETLYFLAASTYAASYPTLASTTWKLLATYTLDPAVEAKTAAFYQKLARRQLNSPWIDPPLNPSQRKIDYPKR